MSRLQVSIKGIRLSPGVRSGDLLDSARQVSVYLNILCVANTSSHQCIYHEIALLRQLKHENICGFLGFDHTHGGTVERPQAPAIISEFCSNGTLSEVIVDFMSVTLATHSIEQYCSRKSQELVFHDRLKLVGDVIGDIYNFMC